MKTRNKGKLIGIYSILIAILTSCASLKSKRERITLPKGTKLVKIKDDPTIAKNRLVEFYKLEAQCRAELHIKENSIEINILDNTKVIRPVSSLSISKLSVVDYKKDTYFRLPFEYQYNGTLKTSRISSSLYGTKKIEGIHAQGERFTYGDISSFNKAITFPFKYRREINDLQRRKRLDYQISTGVNAGLIYGLNFSLKHLWPIYNISSNKLVDVKTSQQSFGLGIFGGLTTIKYTKDNTFDQVLFLEDRTVAGLTYGLAILTTYHKFTIGLSVGKDRPFGQAAVRNNWVYNEKYWVGLTFGFDILK